MANLCEETTSLTAKSEWNCWNVATQHRCCRWHLFRRPLVVWALVVCLVCVCGCVPSVTRVPFVCVCVCVCVCVFWVHFWVNFSLKKRFRSDCWRDTTKEHGVVMDETPLLWSLFDGCHLLRRRSLLYCTPLRMTHQHLVDNDDDGRLSSSVS